MRRGRATVVLLLLLAAGCGAEEPIFQVELWPGEGRPQFETTGEPLSLHESPSRSARILRVIRDRPAGTRVAFDRTRYQTLEPGRIAVLARDTVNGRSLGDVRYLSREDYYRGRHPREARPVEVGDTIDYLQYRAEGTCFVRIEDAVIDASPCPAHGGASFELVAEPRVAWWIRVVPDDASAGWLLVDDSTVTRAGRGFAVGSAGERRRRDR